MLSVIGGGLFLVYGIYNLWFKKIKITADETLSSENMELEEDTTVLEIKRQKKDNIWLFLKGFTLNLLNPGVVIYWLAIVAKGFDLVENHDGYGHIYVFIGIVLTVFFGFDCLKAYLANKHREWK